MPLRDLICRLREGAGIARKGKAPAERSYASLVRGDRRGEAMRQLGSAVPLSARIECEMQSSVGSAAAALGMEVARSYSGERRPDPLNAVHGAMKGFLARFRGLSSRRAQLYLDWFSWHSGFRGPGAARERLSALIALVAVGRWGGSRSRLFGEPYPVEEREAAKAEAAACSRGRMKKHQNGLARPHRQTARTLRMQSSHPGLCVRHAYENGIKASGCWDNLLTKEQPVPNIRREKGLRCP